ncbi:polysaccharide pyruvyl transferase family protein [Rhodococcus sp. SORGH_AS_0301]|uniref:polysaccharide pyruvyl transferase family protein n=1 Tax=Rhodococcus sp. SORGH_AS_0301 TaxID=3041780 RepID=UPI00278527F2|nr:polysaccharide pyruvyl transferase family protein [Rhodococcus sp. SORGH_AS_0301]MDQ1181547.1 polysaccharide pyruvyl transferase WcaK-like protein [Rhodococcus sp. SORGH_AS_0301]
MRKLTAAVHVFVGATGARDNVGDTALRRELFRALRPRGTLHLWVGGLPETYLSGLGLDATDVLYRSRRTWRVAALRHALKGRVLFAFHGGEISLTPAVLRSYALHLPLLALLRVRGGIAVHTSIGVRAPRRRTARILRWILAGCDLVTWRDDRSQEWIGLGTVTPDWAFAHRHGEALPPDDERPLMAVALRHDRPAPSEDYARTVCALAAAHGLDLVMTAQTAADMRSARQWAPLFGARVVEWPSDDLAQAEDVLRHTYRRCRAVVSNRLHGLIMAATEGAVPIGLGTSDVEKLDRGMRAAGLVSVALHAQDSDVALSFAEDVLSRRDEVRRRVIGAAGELDELTDRIAGALERAT